MSAVQKLLSVGRSRVAHLGATRAFAVRDRNSELLRNSTATNFAASSQQQPILFEGGTLIDGTGSQPVPNKALLVHGDAIVAMGDKALHQAQGLGSVNRVNTEGQWLLPGLIDTHCHVSFLEPSSNDELFFHRPSEGLTAILAARDVQKLLLSGCTGFLDADVLYNVGCDLRDAIEIGAVEGPRMATGGNALLTAVGGTAGRLIPDSGRTVAGYAQVVGSQPEIVQTVRRQIKHGVDWIKLHISGLVPRQLQRGEISVWSPEEIRLAVETAHALHTPVVAHVRNAQSTRDAAQAGVDLLLHATNMDDEALEAVLEAGVPLCPTLAFQANLADYGEAAGASTELMDIFRKEIEDSSAILKRAYDEGVPMMCGSESGFSITPLGNWHGREIEVFVKHLGLTPLQAIRCATMEGARGLRLFGKVGVLAEGMMADVIVVDQDPVKDVRVLNDRTRMQHVVSKGRKINLDVPWPTRGTFKNEKVGQWTSVPLTRELAMSLEKNRK